MGFGWIKVGLGLGLGWGCVKVGLSCGLVFLGGSVGWLLRAGVDSLFSLVRAQACCFVLAAEEVSWIQEICRLPSS